MKEDIHGILGWGTWFGSLTWLGSLAYNNWFAQNPPHIPLWGHFLLVIGGVFLINTLIGALVGMLASYVSEWRTGHYQSILWPFIAAAGVHPILSFFAARLALWPFS